MEVIIHGKKVVTTKWLICKLLEITDDGCEIVFVILINFITLKLGLTFDDDDKEQLKKFKATHWLNEDTLFKIRMIKKSS